MTAKVDRIRDDARRRYASEDIEIDGDAQVSWAEHGAWVQAHIWVPDDDDQTEEDTRAGSNA